jgi:3-oxoacyl-[acyl-carrier protein] reductase
MRTVLVGGASKGLGLGCSLALAEAGHRVIMCARNAAVLENAAEDVRSRGTGEVLTQVCDLSKISDLQEIAARIKRDSITVDILINNVGGPAPKNVTELDEGDWEDGLDLLFRSTLRLYAIVLPGMRERKWGRIINILSTTATEPVSTLAVSSVLRAALASYAKLVAADVAREGVTVNSLMPGGFLTDRTEALMADQASREHSSVEEVRQRIASTLPLGRFLNPIELGRLVAFLCSDDASGITGTLIPIDGGSQKAV